MSRTYVSRVREECGGRREGRTVGEEEAGYAFALRGKHVHDLEHKFKHFGRGGEDVSTSWIVVSAFFSLKVTVIHYRVQEGKRGTDRENSKSTSPP
jgi:hypothetical protein